MLRKYGVQTTINFELFQVIGTDFRVDAVHAVGDVKIMKNEGAEANTSNGFADEGTGYSIVLTATEMQAARIVLYFVDQTATKIWVDRVVRIETYGDASSQHAFDLNSANVALTSIGLDSIISTATGMIEIAKAVWDRKLTGATHNISTSAGRRLRGIQEFQGYENGSVWIDTINGTAGTTDYENGTVDNPVDNIADANTLAVSLKISQFTIAIGSSLTLAAAQNNQVFNGRGWVLALGGQDVTGSHFRGAHVSGTGTGTAEFTFLDCELGTCTLDPFHASACGFNGTITFGKAGSYLIHDSYSDIAGSATPIFDTGSLIGDVSLSLPAWSNGIEIQNLNSTGTDLFSISGQGQIIYASTSSGVVNQRGDWKVTNTGGVTITEDDNTENVSSILSRLPSALVGGKMDSDAVAVGGSTDGANRLGKATQANVFCTVGAASTTTSIVTSAMDPTAAVTDQFKGKIVTFDANTSTVNLRGQSTDITASTAAGILTVTSLTNAPLSGDTFVIT